MITSFDVIDDERYSIEHPPTGSPALPEKVALMFSGKAGASVQYTLNDYQLLLARSCSC
jgi:hypothetical protein